MASKNDLIEQAKQQLSSSDFSEEQTKLIINKLNQSNIPQIEQFLKGEKPEGWENFIDEVNSKKQSGPSQEPTPEEPSGKKTEGKEEQTDDTEKPDIENFATILENNPSAQEFMSMCMVTDTFPDPREMDDFQKADFLAKYYSWTAAGEQKPSMPKLSPEKVVIPITFYRILDREQDKMFWKDNQRTWHGRKSEPVYAQQKHPVTGEVLRSNIKTGQGTIKYTKKFSTTEFQQLLSKGKQLNPPNVKMRFYVMKGKTPYVTNSKDFAIKSFDKLYAKASGAIPPTD